MMRWIGLGCLILAGTGWGWYAARRLTLCTAHVRALIHALGVLETEIGFGVSPLPEAFRRVSLVVPSPVSRLFGAVADRLTSQTAEGGAGERCMTAMRDTWQETNLPTTAFASMKALSSMLGWTDRHEQCKHLRWVIAQLSVCEQQAHEQEVRYAPLFRKLGFLLSLLVVIIAI